MKAVIDLDFVSRDLEIILKLALSSSPHAMLPTTTISVTELDARMALTVSFNSSVSYPFVSPLRLSVPETCCDIDFKVAPRSETSGMKGVNLNSLPVISTWIREGISSEVGKFRFPRYVEVDVGRYLVYSAFVECGIIRGGWGRSGNGSGGKGKGFNGATTAAAAANRGEEGFREGDRDYEGDYRGRDDYYYDDREEEEEEDVEEEEGVESNNVNSYNGEEGDKEVNKEEEEEEEYDGGSETLAKKATRDAYSRDANARRGGGGDDDGKIETPPKRLVKRRKRKRRSRDVKNANKREGGEDGYDLGGDGRGGGNGGVESLRRRGGRGGGGEDKRGTGTSAVHEEEDVDVEFGGRRRKDRWGRIGLLFKKVKRKVRTRIFSVLSS